MLYPCNGPVWGHSLGKLPLKSTNTYVKRKRKERSRQIFQITQWCGYFMDKDCKGFVLTHNLHSAAFWFQSLSPHQWPLEKHESPPGHPQGDEHWLGTRIASEY